MHQNDIHCLQKRLEAAEGYLMLDMDAEAWQELEGICPDDLPIPEAASLYLILVLELAVRAENWELGARTAGVLAELVPDHDSAFVHGAYCLHELGQTDKARSMLLAAPESVRSEPVFFYNLGCYHAVLGERTQAIACLNEAFNRDPALKFKARKDPDLRGLGNF